MKHNSGKISFSPQYRFVLKNLLLLLVLPFMQLKAQSFAPNNVYTNWDGSSVFNTIPVVPGLSFTQVLRGPGLGANSASDGMNSNSFNTGTSSFAQAVANGDYDLITITGNASTAFNVTSISLGLRRSGTGPTNFQVEYSINNAAFAPFGTPYSSTSTSNFFQALSTSVSVPAGGNVVFRIEAYGATNVAGTLRVLNSTTINGTVLGTATIATTGVSASSFCVGASAGSPVNVTYSATGAFLSSNLFTAQLSNASGSFASPVTIGTLTGNALTGTINAMIPAGTAAGTGYRIRVVSSLPVVTGTDNGSNLSVLTGIDLSSLSTNVNCYGSGNGSIITNITGGIAPFTYAWSTGDTGSSLTSLSPGTYSLTVTAANGCTSVILPTVITEPAPVFVSAAETAVLCNAAANGAVSLTVNGGTSPYTFAWSNSATTQNISGLTPGTYSVTVTDNNGCSQIASSIIITEPAAISTAAIVTDVLCNASANGSINLNVSGGTSPYNYAWSNSANTPNISGLAAGTYSVTITDNNGCTHIDSLLVSEPAAISVSTATTDVLCNSGASGAVSLTVSGGTVPYTFAWSNSASTQNISNLTAGSYSVTVTDNAGCAFTANATITEPGGISGAVAASNVQCNGGTDGAITLSVSGGTSPYTYAWNNSASTQNISGLAAGTYAVTITDNNGCIQTASALVTEPAAILVSASTTNALCNAATNGSVSLAVSGGTSPYTFAWSNSASTQNISNLAAGTYAVTVTDSNGCVQTASALVSAPAAVSASATTTAVLCNAAANGSVSLAVSGGTSPYTFAWSNSASTQNISNLAAGTYSVTITDNNGCVQTTSVLVTEPAAISASASTTDVLCNAAANGSVSLTVNGGTSPYSFSWSNSASAQNISNLGAGNYSVVITDNNGCTQTVSVSITQPTPLSTSVSSTAASCGICADGTADLTVNGGVSPYTYSWSNGTTTEDLNGVLPGTYTVSITDSNGCQHTDSVTVNFSTGIAGDGALQNNISIYPNPSNGENITLKINGVDKPAMLSLFIYDIAGKEVFSSIIAGNENGTCQLALPLADGTYVYRIQDENETLQSGRLMIVK